MEGPQLGPGGEDITWPTRWPPGAERRLVPAKSNLQPQTSHEQVRVQAYAKGDRC